MLDEPAPTVIFETFGDNALGLLLRCFVDSIDLRVSTISALNEAINDKFNAAGISHRLPAARPASGQHQTAAGSDRTYGTC